MNKEELIKEYDEKAKALRDEFISKLEDDKKEFKLIYPEKNETIYIVKFLEDEVNWGAFYKKDTQIVNAYVNGCVFETSEEAKQHLKERKLLFKIHQWAKEKNGGWELDWGDDSQEKIFIYCFKNLKENLELTYKRTWNINKFIKLPYFKTCEIAQECIDLFGDEIIEVLC